MTPKRSRPEFAVELGRVMGVKLTPNTYWSWERGKRLVPAPAVFAAFRLSGLPLAERTVEERLQAIKEAILRLTSSGP